MSRWHITLLLYAGTVSLAAAWLLPRLEDEPNRFDVAMDLIADGRADDAVHLLEDRIWRGVAEYRADRYRRAVEEFAQGQDVIALYNLGTTYARLGEWGGARAALERALSLDPAHEDAAFNLSLVLQAEDLQRREVEAQQDSRTLGNEVGNDRGTEAPEAGAQTTSEKAEPSTNSAPTDQTSARSGQVPSAGRAGDRALSEDAASGRGQASEADERASNGRTGAGAIRLLQTSTQDTEVLLRAIQDDPEKVLRARLWAIDQERREAGK